MKCVEQSPSPTKMEYKPQKIFYGICILILLSVFYLDSSQNQYFPPPPSSTHQSGKFIFSEHILWNEQMKISNKTKMENQVEKYVENSLLEMPDRFHYHKNSILPGEENYKKILIWTDAYGSGSLGFGVGHEPFVTAGCQYSSCLMTMNRTIFPLDKYDAIIFHFRNLDIEDLPNKRSREQRWIFYEKESSSYIFQSLKPLSGIFNWTMTYKANSDIHTPYGRVIPYKTANLGKENRNYAKYKTKMAAWFVSNCYSHSLREKFVKSMKNYIQVDVYGKCGSFKCPRDNMEECYKMVEKNYKFYLSFENSLCNDYVTEKFFNVLRYNIVPIVYGYTNYSLIAPPNSYIDALKFPSVKHLTKYLQYLDSNDTAYNEYFTWKSKYKALSGWSSMSKDFCHLCKKLHLDKKEKIYENMENWFVLDRPCKTLKTNFILDWLFKKKNTG